MVAQGKQIGWYGLGSMGRLMAENLQKFLASNEHDLPLIYFNRTISAGSGLDQLGATAAGNFADLTTRSDLIFTMVSNDAVLEELLKPVIESEASIADKVFVDCSTLHPETAARVSAALAKRGATFLAAPVFGGPAIAVTGKIVVAIGGPRPAFEQVEPYVLNVIGRKVIYCGKEARSASLLKIGGNIVTLNLMEAVGEAQVFAEKTGLGTTAMEELITDSMGPVAGGYSQRLTTGIYAPPLDTRPGFGVSLSIKDARHALSIAAEQDIKLPGLEVSFRNMNTARDYAGECLDASSMYGVLRKEAGLDFFNGKSRGGK
ncbi:6-phosphogluconate dehydrogenase family protein [Polychaeton citri CBS 116435]|uniref:6-phosphogluconate dehydrogenase family protein n=1 Tax=Polychaeton citri CBS 116435 TaxID=1314669 RepID=A0A9P4PYG0_9PEZI|nr:6-phosphogluconate dehydrogenase family protein [Polychaeton citri CBS 116435]